MKNCHSFLNRLRFTIIISFGVVAGRNLNASIGPQNTDRNYATDMFDGFETRKFACLR